MIHSDAIAAGECHTLDDMPRGGFREDAGRKSAYAGRVLDKSYPMDFTKGGLQILRRIQSSSGLSRNDILAHLLHTHGAAVARGFEEIYLGKARHIMSIRLPKDLGALLEKIRDVTARSYSDIGEYLVRTFGMDAQYPVLPGHEPKRRRRPGARRG